MEENLFVLEKIGFQQKLKPPVRKLFIHIKDKQST